MKQTLIFHTGETTCSEKPSYPGSMCPFVYAISFGTKPVCLLFNEKRLVDKEGWLQRLPECKEHFKGVPEAKEIFKEPF